MTAAVAQSSGPDSRFALAAYWVCTSLAAFVFVSGGIGELMRFPQVISGMSHLGYPVHFVSLLGFWKILGGFVILVPGVARLKEWAYAGMIFNLTGASVAHAVVGDGARHVIVPIVLSLLVLGSWALRPDARKLAQR